MALVDMLKKCLGLIEKPKEVLNEDGHSGYLLVTEMKDGLLVTCSCGEDYKLDIDDKLICPFCGAVAPVATDN